MTAAISGAGAVPFWPSYLPQSLFPELIGDPVTARRPCLCCASCGDVIYEGDRYYATRWGAYCDACARLDLRYADIENEEES